MSILEEASEDELVRLLQLFPASVLKLAWEKPKLTKEAICRAAAKERDLQKIVGLIRTSFARCRMHVHVLSLPDNQPSPLTAITDTEVLQSEAGGPTWILAKVSFVVILQEALTKETVNLLWPMRIEEVEDHTVLSTIVLERNPGVLFDEGVSVVSRSLDEKLITKNLRALNIQAADLHKGMKALWEEDYMDAYKTKFRSPD
ncbi:MAG TPA: hypothetical protein VGM11_01210, partial [Acidobacteriaceae bacterium]